MKTITPAGTLFMDGILGALKENKGYIFINLTDRVVHNDDGTDTQGYGIMFRFGGEEIRNGDKENTKFFLKNMLNVALKMVDQEEESDDGNAE